MAGKACSQRLQKEFRAITKEPPPLIVAKPSPTDILEWHYVIQGSPGTPYEGGLFHGRLKFPPEYPFKPPSIFMLTPNGRFATNTRICMSMSDFHPESWNPMWSVASILTGLQSFMNDESPTAGSIASTASEKKRLAKFSMENNLKSPVFRRMFPDLVAEQKMHRGKPTGGVNGTASAELRDKDEGRSSEVTVQVSSKITSLENANETTMEIKKEKEAHGGSVWVAAIFVAVCAVLMAFPVFTLLNE